MKTKQQALLKLKVENEEEKLQKHHGFELRTKSGYRLDEGVSALQKAIRRGQEERAMYWACEMFESGFVKYLWRRLSVIVLEDIGDPLAVILINSLAQSSERINKKDYTEALHPAMAVMYLCRAPKSREVDYMLEIVDHKRKLGQKLELFDSDLDVHTELGRRKLKQRQTSPNSGKSYDQLVKEKFYFQGALLNDPVSIKGDFWKKKVWKLRKLDKRKFDLKYNPDNG